MREGPKDIRKKMPLRRQSQATHARPLTAIPASSHNEMTQQFPSQISHFWKHQSARPRVGKHEPLPASAFAQQQSARKMGAPCLPYLETWEGNDASSAFLFPSP